MCLPLFLFYPLAAAQTGGGKSRVKTEQRAKGTTAPDMDHFERLLSLYVQAKAERADFYSSMTSLLVFYGGQDDAGKAKCRRCLAQHMDEYYNDRDKPVEALAIADLYESLAAFDDPERLKISYYRGEYAATVEGDSIALHRAISDIEAFPAGQGTDREAHLLVLRDYLEQIRNYVPVDRTIDGIWISDLGTKQFGYPKMILKVIAGKGGSPIFRMYHLPENYAPFFQIGTLISAMSMPERIKPESTGSGTMGAMLGGNGMDAQAEWVYAGDSILAVWSNEKLKNPDADLHAMTRQISGSLTDAVTIAGGGSLEGDLLGGSLSIVSGMLLDELFTPSKEVFVLQGRLRKVNDRQLDAVIYYTYLRAKGSDKPEVKNEEWHTLFTRVEPQDSLYWLLNVGSGAGVYSPFGVTKKDWKLLKKTADYRLAKSSVGSSQKKLRMYNRMQTEKMIYRCEEQLSFQGEEEFSDVRRIHQPGLRPFTGIEGRSDSTGCVVVKVLPESPAFLYRVKCGDLITHVDGFAIKTFEQFERIIGRKNPFDLVEITVKRGKKNKKIKLELYYSL